MLEDSVMTPAWIGYQQALGWGGHVNKDEKATAIVYGSTFVPKDERDKPEEEQHPMPFLKRWFVFNVEQVARLPEHVAPTPRPVSLPDAIEQVEAFLKMIGADVRIRLPTSQNFPIKSIYFIITTKIDGTGLKPLL